MVLSTTSTSLRADLHELTQLARGWRSQSSDLSSVAAALDGAGGGMPPELQDAVTQFKTAWVGALRSLAQQSLSVAEGLASAAATFAASDRSADNAVSTMTKDRW